MMVKISCGQFVLECKGSNIQKCGANTYRTRFSEKRTDQTKKTTIKVNYPEKGYITKSYPLPHK